MPDTDDRVWPHGEHEMNRGDMGGGISDSNLESARPAVHEPLECESCEVGFVKYDGDKFCPECGILSGSSLNEEPTDEWREWQIRRRENDDWEGWYGEERVKVVGSFLSAWCFEEDSLLN